MTLALIRFAPQCLWMSPGLWQITFGLGVFASCRFLPRAMLIVGVWYLASGLAALALAQGSLAFTPWTMGIGFGVGQTLVALVLRYAGRAPMSEPAPFAYEGLDRVIHERARLGVLTSLTAHPKGLVFGDLRRLCGLTDGNLSRHLAVLQETGLVEVTQGLRAQPAADCLPDHAGGPRALPGIPRPCWIRSCATPPPRPRRRPTIAPCPASRSPDPFFWKDALSLQSTCGRQVQPFHVAIIMDGNGRWGRAPGSQPLRRPPGRRRRRPPNGRSRAGPGRDDPDPVRLRLGQLAAAGRGGRRADGGCSGLPGVRRAAADRERRATDR